MPGKTPDNNGNQPIENSIRTKGDGDAKDSGKAKGKKGAKEAGADEEMTFVVPITKTSKPSSEQPQDDDGDVSMGGDDIGDDGEKVDPVAQTVAGMMIISFFFFFSKTLVTIIIVPFASGAGLFVMGIVAFFLCLLFPVFACR